MTAIEKILATGKSERSRAVPIPTEKEILTAEFELSFKFPESYREFVRLGGLSELRLKHRVLSPSDVVQNLRHLPDREHVPFADSGAPKANPRIRRGDASVTSDSHNALRSAESEKVKSRRVTRQSLTDQS